MINIAEEEPEMGPEAPERDGDLSKLPASTMGICAMECIRNKTVQGRRSQNAEAFEAGYNDGYGDGYVDGYDDGQYNQLIGLIRELETMMISPTSDEEDVPGLYTAMLYLRGKLQNDEKEA